MDVTITKLGCLNLYRGALIYLHNFFEKLNVAVIYNNIGGGKIIVEYFFEIFE